MTAVVETAAPQGLVDDSDASASRGGATMRPKCARKLDAERAHRRAGERWIWD